MKLKYSYDYLQKAHKEGLGAWAECRAAELEQKHGVPFCHGVGAGYTYFFAPYLAESVPLVDDPALLTTLLKATKHERYPVPFVLLANETGYSLKTILGAARWLVMHQYALTGKSLGGQYQTSMRWYPGACRIYEGMEDQEYLHTQQTRLVRKISQRNLRKAY